MASGITHDPRFYAVNKQSAITREVHALVEIITNSVDAYKSLVSYFQNEFFIDIEVINIEERKFIKVTDYAKGLSATEMQQKLLTIGAYTADHTSRGVFGRGFKDSSVICKTMYASAFKDNKFSQCELYTYTGGKVNVSDVEATPELREQYGIPENGMQVHLDDVIPEVELLTTLVDSLRKNIHLRNILQDEQFHITIRGEDKTGVHPKKRIVYTPPKGRELYRGPITIKGYENYKATFIINKSEKVIKNPKKPDELEYGIMIGSTKSVFDIGGLYYVPKEGHVSDHRYNSSIKYIYGQLICDGIDELIKDASNGKLDSKNPRVMIDPSRRGGIDKEHPFTAALFEQPNKILSVFLKAVQDEADNYDLNVGDIQGALDIMGEYMSKYLDPETVLYTWRSKEDHQALLGTAEAFANAEFDQEFLGINKDQIKELNSKGQVKVVLESKKSVKKPITIRLTSDENMEDAYDVFYYPEQTVIKINARYPTIKPFININDNGTVELKNPGKATVSIGSLMTESFSEMLLRQYAMRGEFSNVTTDQLSEVNVVKKQISASIAPDIANNVNVAIARIKGLGFSDDPSQQ